RAQRRLPRARARRRARPRSLATRHPLTTKRRKRSRFCCCHMPIDDIALNLAIERAARAEALQRDELLTEALDALDRDYVKAWRATHARDTDARERLWQAVQVVAKVRDHLAPAIAGGRLARSPLGHIAPPAGRA